MSVPPQQPGPHGPQPGGFGQQPGQPGPQQGFGGQPGGYGQPPQGFPQGGQQPPYGPPPGAFPPPGQPGAPGPGPQPYGQQGQFGQPGYGQPGGFGDPYGAPRKKSPLPWVLGGVGVVVIAVVAVLLVTLLGGGSPKDTAQSYVALLNKNSDSDADAESVRGLLCKSDVTKFDEFREKAKESEGDTPGSSELANMKAQHTLGEVTENGDKATAKARVAYSGVPDEYKDFIKDKDYTIDLVKEDGDWKVCGMFKDLEGIGG